MGSLKCISKYIYYCPTNYTIHSLYRALITFSRNKISIMYSAQASTTTHFRLYYSRPNNTIAFRCFNFAIHYMYAFNAKANTA